MNKILLIAFAMISGSLPAIGTSTPNDTLVVPVTTITELNPYIGNDVNLNKVINQITRTLVSLDDSLSPIPNLLKSWSIDTKTRKITFTLKDHIYFHDKTKIVSKSIFEIFKRSLEGRSDLTSQILNFSSCISIEKCKSFVSHSDSKFTVTLKNQNFLLFLRKLAGVEASIFKLSNLGKFVGSGPYKITSQDDRQIRLSRVSDSAPLNTIIFKKILPKDGFKEFRQGKIDLISDIDYDIDGSKIPISKIRQNRIAATFGLVFNSRKGKIFSNLQNRKAVNMAIDKDEFIKFYKKEALPAYGLIPKGFIGHQSNPHKTDVEKARQIVLSETQKEKRKVILALRHKYRGNEAIEKYLPQVFAKIGLHLVIKYDSFNQILKDFRKGKYDLTLKGDGPRYYEPSTVFVPYIAGQFQNISDFTDPLLNKKYYSYENESDKNRKIEMLHQMEDVIRKKLPVVTLFHPVLGTWFQENINIMNFKQLSIRFWDYPYRTFSKNDPS